MKLLLAILLSSLILSIKVKTEHWRGLLIIIFICSLGLVNGLRVPPSATEQLLPYVGREVVVEGWIEPTSVKAKAITSQETVISGIMQCEKLQSGSQTLPYTGRLRVSLTRVKTKQLLDSKVLLQGKVQQLTYLHNPGGFDGKLYNRVNNIGGRLTQAKLLPSTGSPRQVEFSWQSLQHKLSLWNLHLRERLKQGLGAKHGALIGSMLLGGSSAVDEETRALFTANGLSHLLSVSGTHLVLLASFLQIILRPLPSRWRKVYLLVGLSGYALLCGLRAPILRAFLMCSVLLFGRERSEEGARVERGTLLCLVALLLLVMKPLWLLDMGFQLSMGATAGLIWLLPACERRLACLEFLPEEFRSGLAVTCAAQLAVVPLVIMYFHHISVVSFISNLFLVPLLEMVALLSVLGLISLFGVGKICFSVAGFILESLLWQADFLAHIPCSQLVIGELPFWCVLVYYAFLGFWSDLAWMQFWSNFERRLLMCVFIVSLGAALLWQQYKPWELTAYFLDVGQGDCVVLTTPKHRVIIYDTGGLAYLDTGKSVIAPFLRTLGKSEVDLVILSHYDFDHVGGAVGLLNEVKVKKLLLPHEQLETSSLSIHEALVSAATLCKTELEVAIDGLYYQLEDDISLSICLPQVETVAGNDASTVVELRSSKGRLLLTGDLGSEAEQRLGIESFAGPTVFKAGHHGSKYSNGEELLARLRPNLTVISCGAGNRYGHPHAEMLARLEDVGSRVVRTDLGGCLKLLFDSTGIKCYSYIYDTHDTYDNN
ncbi:MAG: DNA internalization-related competence protein ComEC/Rec2 [Phascolarctobacterium sp.]|nr:DNA internalization-related competence protein ComEC/Rec2 [Phascolarctobacterium sp.]